MSEDKLNGLEDALVTMINKSIGYMDGSVVFLQEQLPDVIEQLLMFKMVVSLLQNTFWCGMAIGIAVYFKKWFARVHEDCKNSQFEGIDYVVSIGMVILSSGIAICSFNLDWLYIWIAPKVYLIEYVANMTK